jgi:hypothetical protein
MSENDFKSGQGPQGQDEPLSATAMFLRSFDSAPAPSKESAQASEVKPAVAPPVFGAEASGPASSSAGPGEFTQMFQAIEARPSASAPSAAFQTPPPAPKPEFQASSAPAPGEFTRIFVASSAAPKEPVAKTSAEIPAFQPAATGPSKLKGFSTPGISDSASAEGSFTQFFKTTPSASPPAPATPPPPVQAYTLPPAPAAPPVRDWPREPEYGAASKPFDPGPTSGSGLGSAPAAGSATGMLSSSFGSPAASSPAPWSQEPPPYRAEPLPSYTPAPPPPPAESSGSESGGVTRLIQRLSQVQREAPPEPVIPSTPIPAPPPPASSGPGEFTRMISGSAVKAALSGAAPPPAAPPAAPPAPAAAVPIAAPPLPVPAMPPPPAFKAPAAPPAPKIEAPKLAPPALAAPKGKLEAMVPILLVVNTFLLIVILLVVIFALKGK